MIMIASMNIIVVLCLCWACTESTMMVCKNQTEMTNLTSLQLPHTCNDCSCSVTSASGKLITLSIERIFSISCFVVVYNNSTEHFHTGNTTIFNYTLEGVGKVILKSVDCQNTSRSTILLSSQDGDVRILGGLIGGAIWIISLIVMVLCIVNHKESNSRSSSYRKNSLGSSSYGEHSSDRRTSSVTTLTEQIESIPNDVFRRKRKEKNEMYSPPTTREEDHAYATITPGGPVSMCKNDTYTATNYQLNRLHYDPINCTCLLKSTEQTFTQVYFNMTSISGCGYKLGFYFNTKFAFVSCYSSTSLFHTITSETIKLNLERYHRNSEMTTFIINIISMPETNLTLSCFVPTLESSSTQLPTTIITSIPTTPIPTNFQSKTMVSNTSTESTQLQQVTSKSSSSHQQNIIITTNSDEQTTLNTEQLKHKSPENDGTVGIAVGCFVGGIVFGIVAVLGLQWFRKKRNEKNEMYSTSTIREEDHGYTSITPSSGVIGNTRTVEETAIGEALEAPNSTGENRTSNPTVTYQNISLNAS
ncbi:hypothetical protein LOTGIDRAFT_169915 [Lottia gigantea]|uniref:ZP domain-containing protein n=1 Tax=Lottia gigantea TaxID=225164 RepID=V3ZJP5_LOTGI|nr:hypothetical protein LOTGIDRAFT_169915 [Lottia gigantea]ESO82595.1 hypothetical protein LOTGIDRAFT_169915 [Lottia gigantea]